MKPWIKTILSCALISTTSACASVSQPQSLSMETYNPGTQSVFAVSSTLIEGPTEIVLVDAQFQRNDAEHVVEMIRQTGKELTTVFISHGDPDFYFGLDVITQAFPNAQVLSTAATQAYIQKSMKPKKAHWGPILKENAPQSLIVPDVLDGDTLWVDGKVLTVIGLDGHDPSHTFLWIPSSRAVVGGIPVFDNIHAWMADSQTPESRRDWLDTLDVMSELEPLVVVPGHFLPGSSKSLKSIDYIRQYIKDFETAESQVSSSEALIARMKRQYPGIGGDALLDISSKVATGEMKWP